MRLPEQIDIDRLHGVIDGSITGRRVGKTLSTLMLMLGEAQLGHPENTYLYIGETNSWTQEVKFTFVDLLRSQFEIYDNDLVVVNDHVIKLFIHPSYAQTFLFYSASAITDRIFCGWYFARVFVDVTTETENMYRENILLAQTREF